MKLVITGCPGTGKTTIARALAKALKVDYVALNEIAKKIGKFKRSEFEVNVKKLEKQVKKALRGKNYVVEGHLACEVKIPCNLAVILRCNPLVLMKRLKKRRYAREKVIDNALAEAQDYFIFKVEENYGKNYIVIDTTRKVTALALLKAIKKRKTTCVNWDKELVKLASQGF